MYDGPVNSPVPSYKCPVSSSYKPLPSCFLRKKRAGARHSHHLLTVCGAVVAGGLGHNEAFSSGVFFVFTTGRTRRGELEGFVVDPVLLALFIVRCAGSLPAAYWQPLFHLPFRHAGRGREGGREGIGKSVCKCKKRMHPG